MLIYSRTAQPDGAPIAVPAYFRIFLDAPSGGHDEASTTPHVSVGSDNNLEGRRIGDYLIRREIGRGGMGMVYLADDMSLQRRVALKALNPDLSQTSDLRERLRNEETDRSSSTWSN